MKAKPMTDAEIDAARERGRREAESQVHAVSASYDAKSDRVVIELDSGYAFMVPRKLMQGLGDATPAQLRRVVVLPTGNAIAWDVPDVGFLVDPLFRGIVGSARWMSELGRSGGLARSAAKAASSRKNGAKGGRPRKPVAK